jgi:hypothetical protein
VQSVADKLLIHISNSKKLWKMSPNKNIMTKLKIMSKYSNTERYIRTANEQYSGIKNHDKRFPGENGHNVKLIVFITKIS